MASILALLLSNKWLLAAIGGLSALGGVYFKGYKSGTSSVEKEIAGAELQQQKNLQKVEAVNQQVETERAKNAQNIDVADDINDLISMWNRLDKKTPDSDAKPNP